jgi:curli biogenesis system outer membrane secretion channel CsgG
VGHNSPSFFVVHCNIEGGSLRKYLLNLSLVGLILILFLHSACVPPGKIEIDDQEEQIPEVKIRGPKRYLAVLNFENESGEGGQKIGGAVADKLISQLAQQNSFILIERSELESILLEQGLSQSGMMTEESGVEAGKLLGVQALLMGKIHEFSQKMEKGKIGDDDSKWQFKLNAAFARVTLSYKLVDTVTGEILFSDQVSEQKLKPSFGLRTKDFDFDNLFEIDQTLIGKSLNKAISKITREVVQHAHKITWYGKVIRVTDEFIYFTPGITAGVQLNDIFEVQPRTEEEVDVVPDSLDRTLIKVTGFLRDKLSKAELIQGVTVESGDWVVECQPVETTVTNTEIDEP